ncbi:hypothetical protein [Hyphomonas sp.]|uniref:hypothetical protein n=1 Tax=Hyphomonas sp. TaxID=87 RepID=UPI0025C0AD38|nr:hypothetical protein [Hyphomonas sp.]
MTPDETLARFTSDFEAELAANPSQVSYREIEFAKSTVQVQLGGTRDEYQRAHRLGVRGLEILEPYRACLGPHLAANETALIGMRDQGRRGCEMTSTDPASCDLNAPAPPAILRRNTGTTPAMQASVDQAVAYERDRPQREAAAERERIRQEQEYARQQELAQRNAEQRRINEANELQDLQAMFGVIGAISNALAAEQTTSSSSGSSSGDPCKGLLDRPGGCGVR